MGPIPARALRIFPEQIPAGIFPEIPSKPPHVGIFASTACGSCDICGVWCGVCVLVWEEQLLGFAGISQPCFSLWMFHIPFPAALPAYSHPTANTLTHPSQPRAGRNPRKDPTDAKGENSHPTDYSDHGMQIIWKHNCTLINTEIIPEANKVPSFPSPVFVCWRVEGMFWGGREG